MNKQAIKKHNAPLHKAMLDKGCKFVQNGVAEYFQNPQGFYEPYPPGYIRGPHYENNRNPNPYTMSVQGRNGWLQRSFSAKEIHNGEAAKWSLETGKEILAENA